MTREQLDAVPFGDSCASAPPRHAPLPACPDALEPHPEQTALLQTMGLLVPSLAHDLSNPLCGVRNVLERLVRKTAQDDAERHLLHLALQQCDQMRHLLRELQEFAAPPNAGRATFALDQSLASALLLVRKQLLRCGCGVEFAPPARPLWLHGEEPRIRLLLVHLLLSCGRTAMPAGSCLHIQAGVEGDATLLCLRWPLAPGPKESPHLPLSGHASAPWFEAILRQHGGVLQTHQQADGLRRLTLSFPLPPEEPR